MKFTRSSAVLAVLVVISGCSSKAPAQSDDAAGGLTTDFGITAEQIKLGVLTDLSGPFASLATPWLRGQELYYDELNADGGICGRSVDLVTRDHAYNVQNAVQQYAQVEPDVLGFSHLVGSPMIAALLPTVSEDKTLSAVGSWASPLLSNPYVLMAGTPSDIEMINGVEYLFAQGLLRPGDRIGALYIEGEYGANGLAGAKYAADQLGLELLEAKITATTTDATSAIVQFKAAGVKAITLTTSSAQTGSALNVAAQSMPDTKFIANSAAFVPGLLNTNAAGALERNLFVAGSALPFTATSPEVTAVREAFKRAYPQDGGSAGVTYGYGVAQIYASVLKQACTNGDMTRAGVEAAFRETSQAETGVIAPLDFSEPGQPPARAAYIARVTGAAEGGLEIVKPLEASPLALKYELE